MWQTIILDIISTGMTQKEVGDFVGLSQPQICDMANGKYREGPRGDRALKIVELHRIKCPPKTDPASTPSMNEGGT